MKRTMYRIAGLLAILVLLPVVATAVVRLADASRIRISSTDGIQSEAYWTIGGCEQFVQIRSQHQDNPVILYLHGGPGEPRAYFTGYYQTALEKDYTMVCYDQRGCGRTYDRNEGTEANEQLSTEQLLLDLDDLVDQLCEQFGQERIILMGHSWGTQLGSLYIQQHPEKVSQYIGVSQMIDGVDGDRAAVEEACHRAEEQGEDADSKELWELFDNYAQIQSVKTLDYSGYRRMRSLLSRYLPGSDRTAWENFWMRYSSSQMNEQDRSWYRFIQNREAYFTQQQPLMDDCMFGIDLREEELIYEVPVTCLMGTNDWITPVSLVKDYLDSVTAPDKELILIENAGHSPMLDDPESFCNAVKQALEMENQ